MANLPDVNCKYGAPMGRGTWHEADTDTPIKFHLSRVYLDSGGYDSGGAYWGIGQRLYQASGQTTPDSDIVAEFYVRASDRDDAKEQVRDRYPNARFYR